MFYEIANDGGALIRGRAQVGEARVTVCTDGSCLFDGGAMFGVVPRTLWSRKMQHDEHNRVQLGLNCVLVEIAGKRILIETGFGNKLSPKLQEIYGSKQLLLESLKAAGVMPEQIDLVINSHLHWDHCSWNTTLLEDGTVVPTFPRAQYIAHVGEVEHGRLQLERDKVSYVPENYEPLLANGQMRLVGPADFDERGRCALAEGLWLEVFPGHTDQLMVVRIESGGENACFVSDLVPTAAHLDLGWVMAFDIDPLRTIEERKRFYETAVQEGWLVLFPHDHVLPMGVLERDQKGRVTVQAHASS